MTKGGFDWRVPPWMRDVLPKGKRVYVNSENLQEAVNSSMGILRTVFQAHDGGMAWYNEDVKPGESSYEEVYHEVWKAMFTPVPAIASAVKRVLDDNGLVPNGYSAAHLRVLYQQNDRKEGVLQRWTRGGINCASTLRPGKPIFLTSDSDYVTTYGPIYGREQNGTIVVHESYPNPPLHLDQADIVQRNGTLLSRPPPSDFYDTFTDLYLLALSGCVFSSKGGYGMWAIYIGGNLKCGYRSKGWNKLANACEFMGRRESSSSTTTITRVNNEPIFLEPMEP
jgi:hypothetical protein